MKPRVNMDGRRAVPSCSSLLFFVVIHNLRRRIFSISFLFQQQQQQQQQYLGLKLLEQYSMGKVTDGS
jgi:hypothetical protein